MASLSPPLRPKSTSIPSMLRRRSTVASDPGNEHARQDTVSDLSKQPGNSGRRKSSIGSLKLGGSIRNLASRPKKSRIDSIAESEPQISLGRLFFGLPQELQVHIVSILDFQDVLRLRRSSALLKALVDSCEGDIVRFHVKTYIDPYTLELFPATDLSRVRLDHLSGIHHRHLVCSKLAHHLADFVREETCRVLSVRRIKKWAPKHEKLRASFETPLLTLFKFFEDMRTSFVSNPSRFPEVPPADAHPKEKQYIESNIPLSHLLDTYQTYTFLLSAIERRWRPPTYAGRLERGLRGWTKSTPPNTAYAALFYVGGLREVERTWQPDRPFSVRRKQFDLAINRLIYVRSAQQRSRTSSIASSSRAPSILSEHQGLSAAGEANSVRPMPELSADEVEALLEVVPPLPQIFGPAAKAVLLEKEVVENEDDIRHWSFWLSSLLGESSVERGDEEIGEEEEESEGEEEDNMHHQALSQETSPAYDGPVWTNVV